MATKDFLELQKENFEKWAIENGVLIFPVDGDYELTTIVYDDSDDENLDRFKEIILGVKPKFLFLETVIEDEGSIEVFEENIEWYKAQDENFEKNYAILKESIGRYIQVCIGFVYEGVLYQAIKDADWADIYNYWEELREEYSGNEINSEEEGNNLVTREMPFEEQKLLACKIALKVEYENAQTNTERSGIAGKYIKQYMDEYGFNEPALWRLERLVKDKYFEIQEKLKERELIKLLKEYKALKYSKVKCAGLLKISSRKLDKYWYLEE